MEGPTPVSAFLHAASMITAGVYFFFVFSFFSLSNFFIIFSIFTTFFFSLNAFNFFDLKRIVASSTGSQLGYIYFFLSLNLLYCGLLLFSFHAIFKSFLFFIAGYVISLSFNSQDLRVVFIEFFNFLFLSLCFFGLIGLFFFLVWFD